MDAPSGRTPSEALRFARQIRFAPLGAAGQARLRAARVLLVGCGATGGVLAQTLTRAGVGTLVVVDRDVVEPSNLPRQVLFHDGHAEAGTPKALAAAETLAAIGGPTRVEPHVTHVDATNLPELAAGARLVLDGTDNLATRYLLNDLSVAQGVPWVYAGVVGGSGLVMPILPGKGPCLRCLFPEAPAPGVLPTCETAGVVLPAVGAVASLAAGSAMRILAAEDAGDWPEPRLVELDVWNGTTRTLEASADPACPACAAGEHPFLEAGRTRTAAVLCGRNTVQLPALDQPPDLTRLAERLAADAEVLGRNELFVRARSEELTLTVFRDGRALVEGTEDPARAQSHFDRWVGR